MKPAYQPGSLREALEILASSPATPVAGGTDLMVRHRRHAPLPVRLEAPPLFIATLSDLRTVIKRSHGLVIGAAVTLSELLSRTETPAGLRRTLTEFAAPAIRNAATLGGNICNASPAADTLPFLYAVGATVRLASASGERELPVREFVIGPGQTSRRADELLVSVDLPASEPRRGATDFIYYRKVAPRRSNALSKLSVYAQARTRDGRAESFRLALGAVAPTVVRSEEAEELVNGASGRELNERLEDLLGQINEKLSPIDDQRSRSDYRRKTALRIVRDIISTQLPHYLETR